MMNLQYLHVQNGYTSTPQTTIMYQSNVVGKVSNIVDSDKYSEFPGGLLTQM